MTRPLRITSIGGGPAGLYTAILMKKAFPETEITVLERNRADDTFGWGVVFSHETLSHFEAADAKTFEAITEGFRYWDDIETYYRDTCVRSTGHGFAGMSRRQLLVIMQERCRELGVELKFEHDVADPLSLRKDCDLLLGADGVNSLVREGWKEHFRPTIHWGKCWFTWLGTTLPLEAFTFVFRENDHGLFQVHAYPFEDGTSTWIVECHEDVWRRAGLDNVTEEETVAYCTKLFEEDLKGHPLLTNRSVWRCFPTIQNQKWSHENVVLMGDAVHTAHFSVGSGTKLAMEDSIALVEAFQTHGTDDVPKALQAYEDARWVDVVKLQKAARTSRQWFEESARYSGQHPVRFNFNLMTRSKRITYDNLALRDPQLVEDVTTWFAHEAGAKPRRDGSPCPPAFTPFELRALRLENRIVVSPMCQYSATDGLPNDWHLVHLGSRALGGAGLVMTEMTNVSPEGRITYGCAGIWSDDHVAAWKRTVDFVRAHSTAKIGMQIAHSGRKGSCHRPWEGDRPLLEGEGHWPLIAPSPIPFDNRHPTPREMDGDDLDRVRDKFVAAARRAEMVGFDLLELHAAHGYLLSSFLSPVSNQRTDEYGGSLTNRMRWPLEVVEAVRAVWPGDKPLSVRISASDWLQDGSGMTIEDSVVISRELAARGVDIIDVSSGGNTPASRPVLGRMYQVPFAERIRHDANVPVMAVGAIMSIDHVNTLVAAGRADLCAIARRHLWDPYLTNHAAADYQQWDAPWPNQYLAARPRPRAEGRRDERIE